jgi:tetratricopeptide (TPR) repeat protein
MKISIKNILLFISVFILGSASCMLKAQSLSEQLEAAQDLFQREKYFDAITEFKRLLFFDKENLYAFEANYLIGMSYKNGAKFSEAIRYFSLAEMNSSNFNDRFNSRIEIVRANILRRTPQQALELLDQLEKEMKNSSKKNEINYWRGWAYIFSDEWESAANEFSKISSDHELKIFCEKVEDEKYSPTAARIMSHLIPGSGQFYTGNVLNGLISLGWNILFGYLTINSFMEERIFDGIITANLLWLRFYNGNVQNAVKFAEEENLKITNEALLFLQTEYSGEKP